jgi:hypothetical protein
MFDLFRSCSWAFLSLIVCLLMLVNAVRAEDGDLAKSAQNPVADLVSLPFQNNTNFGVGPSDATQNILNIQPVVPIELNEDWNLITRTILPVVSQEGLAPGVGSETGLGDTTFTAFFSPADSSGLIWGVGPVALIPTSTSNKLGAGEWGGGLSAVGLAIKGPIVAGALVNNIWSVDGSVNAFLAQPFINYNFDDGWYAVSGPIITGNWEANSSDRWTVPVGGGFGRVFAIGGQPVNITAQSYYNVTKPDNGADWTLRLQLQLLFPKQ